jgi:hypothetical protein
MKKARRDLSPESLRRSRREVVISNQYWEIMNDEG